MSVTYGVTISGIWFVLTLLFRNMAPKTMPINDRLQRIEHRLAELNNETHQMRLFCFDIHPEHSRRVVETMLEIEKKVIANVVSFESKVEDINATVKSLVVKSSNDCLALILDELNNKISGLDGRLTGVSRHHNQIATELHSTIKRLNEFGDFVDETLSNASQSAFQTLETQLDERILTVVNSSIKQYDDGLAKKVAHVLNISCSTCQEPLALVAASRCKFCRSYDDSLQSRGRSRERFGMKQQALIERARSVSSSHELREVITEARKVAANDRIDSITETTAYQSKKDT